MVKWLTQPAVNRSCMGSTPIIRPIKEKSALIHYKLCSKLFLYLNTGVEVPELIIKWYTCKRQKSPESTKLFEP